MRDWQQVSIKQRLFDAMGAYHYLSSQSYIKPSQIGLIGWSFGGSTALFAQKLAEKILNLTKSTSQITYMELPENDPLKRQPDIKLANNLTDKLIGLLK